MRLHLLILATIAICSCGQTSRDFQSLYTLDTARFFLPLDKFSDTSYVGQDTFLVNWYSGMLRGLQEPILFNQTSSKEVYRLTWLRTFHNPVAIRIEKKGEQYSLYWKVSSGQGGYEPGQLITDESKEISEVQWENFQNLLQKAKFWDAKTMDRELSMTDGAQWILEGVANRAYHVVDRQTPRDNDYFNCGNYLIEMTDMDIPIDDKY